MNENQQNKFKQLMNKVKEPPHGGLATTKSNRFQDQPWYIKLWRLRWYLKIPLDTIVYRFNSRFTDGEWKKAYSLAIGNAQYKMKWIYTLQEATKILENKRKK